MAARSASRPFSSAKPAVGRRSMQHIEKQVKQLIKNSVSDAFAGYHSDTNKLRSHDAKKITDQIYRKIYNILGSEE